MTRTVPTEPRAVSELGPRKVGSVNAPYPHNQWYVVAMSDEIGRTMLERWVLDEPLLLYRTQAGTPVVLDNRCPHRFFPLAQGHLVGDNVVCGYHGFTFDACGQCVYVPSQDRIPPGATLRRYPVVERAPWVWAWMGDPGLADESRLPDHHWLSAPGWAHFRGYTHVKAGYLMLHENLLDLTHFGYLHAGNIGTPAWATAPIVVEVDDDVVRSSRMHENAEAPALHGVPMGVMGRMVDRAAVGEFVSPAFHAAHASIRLREPQAGERAMYNYEVLHALTPESTKSTHYFFAHARSYALDQAWATEFTREALMRAFVEDITALEGIQSLVDRDHRQLRDISVVGDKAGNAMLHIVHRLVAAEQEQAALAGRRP